MRILLLTAIAVLTSLTLFAQPELDETHVEGYIIDKKGKRSEGILLLNGAYEQYPYLNQNKVGFMTRKKWDGLKKVKNKEFDTYKGKDLQEFGFGEVRYIATKWVAADGALDPLAAGKVMLYELIVDRKTFKVLKVWPSGNKFTGSGEQIASVAAILLDGMKAPKVWDQMNYGKMFADCSTIVGNIESGKYKPLTMRTGKVSIGGAITKEMMNEKDENGMEKGLVQAINLLHDVEEGACKE